MGGRRFDLPRTGQCSGHDVGGQVGSLITGGAEGLR
jgi:hypothetical protein